MAKVGRPKAFKSPDQLLQLFIDYKKHCEDNPLQKMEYRGQHAVKVMVDLPKPLTMCGFEVYSFENGFPVDLSHYFINYQERYTEFVGVCKVIKGAIRDHQIAGGLAGVYNPSITQRLNNLVDKTETKAKVESSVELDLSKVSTDALKEFVNATKKPNTKPGKSN